MKTRQDPIRANEFTQPTVVVRLTDFYHPGIEHERVALYEATRAHWSTKQDRRIQRAKIALAVHDSIVLEVYEIAAWVPANSTMMALRLDPGAKDRIEFVGNLARASIRDRFIGRSIKGLLPYGNVRPVVCFGFQK